MFQVRPLSAGPRLQINKDLAGPEISNKMFLSVQYFVVESFSFRGKICCLCMSQAWRNALSALMCQGWLDMLMTIMAVKRHVPQLKGMYLKNIWCGLKTLKTLWKDTSDRTCHRMMQSCWKNLVFIASFWGVKYPGPIPLWSWLWKQFCHERFEN